ncbi:MAG: tRNA pseudouridine38-40 synthase [Actinomycetota bacterium]|nr:tRNA pseudouridine38-40 synthase [Actinomycetota bacterium]
MTTHNQHESEEPAGDGGLLRVRVRLGYDGTDFHGWARQPGLRTVQGEVEEALATALRLTVRPRTVCAGRTDAGVHARDQHLHVDVPTAQWPGEGAQVARRLNGLLPADVRIFECSAAPPGFDARFSVRSRAYRYRVCDGAEVDPLQRRFVVGHPRRLDLAAMNSAAADLLGEHDFAAFCRFRAGSTTVRTLLRMEWRRDHDGLADLVVRADAFCHSMVRSLVGVLLPVGDGRRDTAWPQQMLAEGMRSPEIVVAPARGLVLDRVEYAEDVAAQAVVARRVRA